MRTTITLILCLVLAPAGEAATATGLSVKGVRYFSYATFTRLVFETEAAAPYVFVKAADGRSYLLTAYDGPLALQAPLPVIHDGVVRGVAKKEEGGKTYLSIQLEQTAGEVKDFVLRGPDRIVLDIARGVVAPVVAPALPAGKSTAIVLDPGHGGTDTGIVTPEGPEKTVALELAQAVRRLLIKRDARLSVILTREKDQALSLDERAAISNAAGAALFVSIHVARDGAGRVYIQDVDESGNPRTAQPVIRDFIGYETGSEHEEKLWGGQQASHARESGVLGRKLAQQIGGADRSEPVQAPLAALKAVDAAAVLLEVGAAHDRGRAAEAVAKGIESYVGENR